MIVCFQGKGGAGKSTVSALYAQWLVENGYTVLYLDADVNQSSASKLQVSTDERDTMPTISEAWNNGSLKRYLIGTGPFGEEHMTKTTHPVLGSRRFFIDPEHPVLETLSVLTSSGVYFARTGDLGPKDQGSCNHSKTHGVEALLNHYVPDDKGVLIIDMMAGNDNTATKIPFFGANIVVSNEGEPTLGVLRQLAEYKSMSLIAVGNDILPERLRTRVFGRLPGAQQWAGRGNMRLFASRVEEIETIVTTPPLVVPELLLRGKANQPLGLYRNDRWETIIRSGHALTLGDLTRSERRHLDVVFEALLERSREAQPSPRELHAHGLPVPPTRVSEEDRAHAMNQNDLQKPESKTPHIAKAPGSSAPRARMPSAQTSTSPGPMLLR